MDELDIELALVEDAERLHRETAAVDEEALLRRVYTALGLNVPAPGIEPGTSASGERRSIH